MVYFIAPHMEKSPNIKKTIGQNKVLKSNEKQMSARPENNDKTLNNITAENMLFLDIKPDATILCSPFLFLSAPFIPSP